MAARWCCARSYARRSRAERALRSLAFWGIAAPFSLALMAQVAFVVHQIAIVEPALGSQGAGIAVALTAIMAMVGRVGRDIDGGAGPLDPSLEGLADPPGGVGGKLVALGPVELLDRSDQADRALLDEVQEVHTGALVALGPVDDEAQVRLDHLPLGRLVTLGDAPAQVELLGRPGNCPGTDLLEVQARQIEGGTARVSMGSLDADGLSLLVKFFSWAPV